MVLSRGIDFSSPGHLEPILHLIIEQTWPLVSILAILLSMDKWALILN